MKPSRGLAKKEDEEEDELEERQPEDEAGKEEGDGEEEEEEEDEGEDEDDSARRWRRRRRLEEAIRSVIKEATLLSQAARVMIVEACVDVDEEEDDPEWLAVLVARGAVRAVLGEGKRRVQPRHVEPLLYVLRETRVLPP